MAGKKLVNSDAKDIAEAVIDLTEARQVTGKVLNLDNRAQVDLW
jgi:hypothetical protein